MGFNINGKEPNIVGKLCKSLYLIQQQEGDTVTDPANMAYFNFDGKWFKLCFDGETIFWRENESPSEPINQDLACCLVLLNLSELQGVVGQRLERIEYSCDHESVSAKLTFNSGKFLRLTHNGFDDYTSISS
ncbi:hypothetical protein L2750_10820 [Shewanella submarina]|uniref:Uncharacterized protein n=1 Tax=Shewanella submarina TaxID=2016376 RepID=A0ABV7GER9_9GAMM|nr:hypothetical protein [Shewanella submarina]MCL1037642.1 hypothetical protein [Shewanella submarina]